MRLTLENIAKVRKADVEINGITVIAGENNTGKSTVGKALDSVFNSIYHVEDGSMENPDFPARFWQQGSRGRK